MSSLRRYRLGDPVDGLLMLAADVEEFEEAGQSQLLASNLIPTRMYGCTDEDLTELGFALGEVVDGDPLFRHAVLPAGWCRRPEQDSRGSYLVDEHGRDRASITYKAAPYDRKASMVLYPALEEAGGDG